MRPEAFISACWSRGIGLAPRPNGGLAIYGEYPETCLHYGKQWKHLIRPLLLAGTPSGVVWKQDGKTGWVVSALFTDDEGPNLAVGVGETREEALADLEEQAESDPYLTPPHRMMLIALCAIEAGNVAHWEGGNESGSETPDTNPGPG